MGWSAFNKIHMATVPTKLLLSEAIVADDILCNLSIIRQVYSDTDYVMIDGEVKGDKWLNEWRVQLMEEGVSQFLVKMMCTHDHVVIYAASKALVHLLTNNCVSIEKLKTFVSYILEQFRKDNFYLGNVYYLQVFTEVLKLEKKQLKLKGCGLAKLECCLSLLMPHWPHIVGNILKKSSTLKPINQLLLQLLQLILQLLRCYSLTSVTSNEYMVLLQALPSVYKSVKIADCLMCWIKFVNILKKCFTSSLCNDQIVPIANNIFSCHEFPLFPLLLKWIDREGSYISSSMLLGFGVFSDNICEPALTTIEDKVSNTLLRYSFLLLLSTEIISHQTTYLQSALDSLHTIFDAIGSHATQFTVPCHLKQEFTQHMIVHLLSEQDNCLVELFTSSLELSKEYSKLPCLKIHNLFVTFLYTISFDHSTVLDFIVSTETNFDAFFKNYTIFLKEDEQLTYFIGTCKERDNLGDLLIKEQKAKETNTSLILGKKRLLETNSLPSSCKRLNFEANDINVEITDSETDEEPEICEFGTIYKVLNMLTSLSTSLTKVYRRKLLSESKLLSISEIVITSDTIIKKIASYIFE